MQNFKLFENLLLSEQQWNNISLREVMKMTIVSPENWQKFNKYETEFKTNWDRAKSLPN